ncbi:unnamed protein product, partial [Meganyctiphanes norvegica]
MVTFVPILFLKELIPFKSNRNILIFLELQTLPATCSVCTPRINFRVSSGGLPVIPWLGFTLLLSYFAFLVRFHTLHPALLLIAVVSQLLTLIYRVKRKVISETLLVVAGLGVQTTTTFMTGKQNTNFIPWGSLIDIVISETISMQRVLYYMVLLVKNEEKSSRMKLLPLFMHTWPRLASLQNIYRHCQAVLQIHPKKSY